MRNQTKDLLPLFLVIMIDGMGLGLLFPVLNTLIIDPNSHFLYLHLSVNARQILFSAIISIFMLCWFFGAAVLGDYSDQAGRKKALLICLIGSFVGYLIAAISIPMHSLSLMFIGRIIAGFTAGSQPVAQAAIIDISSEEHKARNLSWILLASSIGFVLGPVFGGILSNHALVSWFNATTPLFFAALVALLNAWLLAKYFSETFTRKANVKIKLFNALSLFKSAFTNKNIRFLSVVLTVMVFGWAEYYSFIGILLTHRFEFDSFKIALFLSVLSVGFAAGCYLVDLLTKLLKMHILCALSFFAAAIFAAIISQAHNETLTWCCGLCIGIAIAIGYSTILALFSDQVSADEQGWVMGVSGSIMALCFGLSTFSAGLFASISANLPIIITAICLTTAGVLLISWRKKPTA
jgi:MFS transporter, DHA1 family, tetracycline resistance protein